MKFPEIRSRRLRKTRARRDLFTECTVTPNSLVAPIFIDHNLEGKHSTSPIQSLPGLSRVSIDSLPETVEELLKVGISSVLLFGIPKFKDTRGTAALSKDSVIVLSIRAIKEQFLSDVNVIADCCCCEYTSHGHCGILNKDLSVDNDLTLEILIEQALLHAEAGADFIAPSGMLDGTVYSIRKALDNHGYTDVGIINYSAKFSSALYSPFRDAVSSSLEIGDRKNHQLPIANSKEATKKVLLDISEGADAVIVKPATLYLDIIANLKNIVEVPILAYSVSGEYAMIKSLAGSDKSLEAQLVYEQLTSIKRSGADVIITYFAKQFADLFKNRVF